MNGILDFLTDVSVAAAVTTASHFGVAIDVEPRPQAAAEAPRTVRRTAVSASSRPAARTIRASAQ